MSDQRPNPGSPGWNPPGRTPPPQPGVPSAPPPPQRPSTNPPPGAPPTGPPPGTVPPAQGFPPPGAPAGPVPPSGYGSPQGGPPPPPGSVPPPGYGSTPPPKRGKGKLAIALVAVGVLAVAAIGFFVVRAVTGGSGGAGSPEAAAEDLAAALEAEDPVAALATMNPDEVEALGDVYESAADRATALGFAPDEDALGGVDLALSGVTYQVDELGPDVSRVTISGGSADISVTRDELGGETDAVVERAAEVDDEEVDRTIEGELADEDLVITSEEGDEVDPFLITVRRDGGWYVSPLFTAAQYAVDSFGLASPDLPPPDAGEGADDPEAAVVELLTGVGEADGPASGDLTAGEAGEVVRSYPGALEELVGRLGDDTSVDVTVETDAAEREAGGMAVTVTRIEGTLSYTDEDGDDRVADVVWDGTCLEVDDHAADDGDATMSDDEERDVASSDFCLTEGWAQTGVDALTVVAIEEDGGWRVDPLATLTDYAADIVPEISADTILRAVDYPELAEPTDSVAAGAAVDVDLNNAGFAVVTVDATAGEPFTVSADLGGDVDDEVQAFLVTPSGEYESAFSLIEPDESGEYLLVVGKDGWSTGTVSVRVSRLVRKDLEVGTAESGGLGQPGDIVEYSVDLDAEHPYELVYNDPDLDYAVIDAEGTALDLVELDEGTAAFTTGDAGTYAVRVDGGLDEVTGSFRVNVVEVEPFVLGNGTSPEATGEIAAPGDIQFIDLTIQGGQEVVVDLTPDDPAFDPVFIVKDPDTDTELRRFNSGGPGQAESVSFTPDETTSWRIEVQGSASTVGTFTLSASQA